MKPLIEYVWLGGKLHLGESLIHDTRTAGYHGRKSWNENINHSKPSEERHMDPSSVRRKGKGIKRCQWSSCEGWTFVSHDRVIP